MKKWIPSWRYVPINYNTEVGVFENITQKSVFTNNLNGERVRIRLNNLYSPVPLEIEHVTLTARSRVTGRVSFTSDVTLNGSTQICIPPDTQLYSDELAQTVSCEDDFIVSMYFAKHTSIRCVCTTNACYGWQSAQLTGNYYETDALGYTIKSQLVPVLASDPHPMQFAVGISEISVLADEDVTLIALFGDSITHMSYFFDSLLALLYKQYPGKCALINGGIAGNRIQKGAPIIKDFPGEGAQSGIAGQKRFEADVYGGACPDIVFIMEGVNDCSHTILFEGPPIPTADDIYAALTDVIKKAHAHGSKVYVSTITPFGAFGEWWREQAEELRVRYNALIRSGSEADDMLDMDEIMRSPDDIHKMQEGMHIGDGVHPSWQGGKKMAAALAERLQHNENIGGACI